MAFKALNWSPNEIIGTVKTNQMTDNAEWLRDNTPRATYTIPGGITRREGIKIVSGRATIAKKMTSDSTSRRVRFGNFFTAYCQPMITTGIVANHQVKIFCTISGNGKLHPDHTGFSIWINIDADAKVHDKVTRTFFVHWTAVGY